MCGINGFNWPDTTIIDRMNEAVKQRGPDGVGIFVDPNVSLGHRRLAIIDLSPKGKQPMCNEDASIWLVYNGEIYNFKDLKKELEHVGHIFRSNTDSEVIIHAYEEYGIDFVKKFSGMWAFCIYDSSKGQLILSRDRFGIKPLYYYIDDSRLIFSSLIAGILCHNITTEPNDRAIMEYLAFDLEHHEEYTFFENIYSLKPGSILVYDLKKKRAEKRHWYYPTNNLTPDENTIRELFINSVKSMTLADVPIGSCLSGGLDSSAIVMLLDKFLDYEFNTYSFIAPGTSFDESKYIKEIGINTKTRQFFTMIPAEEFLEDISDFIMTQEEPVNGVSPFAGYRVMKLAHSQGAKVLLDGQGGDEIFAGYACYFIYYFYELLTTFKWNALLNEIRLYRKNSKSNYAIRMLGFIATPNRFKYPIWKRMANTWVNYDFLQSVNSNPIDPRWKARNLRDSQLLTLFNTDIPHLLMWEDKNSMRWGIESRVPFLDAALVESAILLSKEQKINNGRTKVIFRRATENLIPDLIRNRTDKIGFQAPSANLFRNEKVISFVRDLLYSNSFMKRPYWRWKRVDKLFNDHVEEKRNAGDTIWKLVNTELWLNHYFR
ncbi:asparagine synthase (glutamine-hydrolyzing) [Chloroflexota bacterium]